MRIEGVVCSKEEVEDFQKFAPDSPGAKLLERVIVMVDKEAMEIALGLGNKDGEIRQAQGMHWALARVEEIARKIVEWRENEEKDVEDEDEEEAIDVGF